MTKKRSVKEVWNDVKFDLGRAPTTSEVQRQIERDRLEQALRQEAHGDPQFRHELEAMLDEAARTHNGALYERLMALQETETRMAAEARAQLMMLRYGQAQERLHGRMERWGDRVGGASGRARLDQKAIKRASGRLQQFAADLRDNQDVMNDAFIGLGSASGTRGGQPMTESVRASMMERRRRLERGDQG